MVNPFYKYEIVFNFIAFNKLTKIRGNMTKLNFIISSYI